MEIVTRPQFLILLLIVAIVGFFVVKSTNSGSDFKIEASVESKTSLRLSSFMAGALFIMFAGAIWMAWDYKLLAKLSSITIAVAGLLIAATVVIVDQLKLRKIAVARAAGDVAAGGTFTQFFNAHKRQVAVFGAIFAMALMTQVVGTYVGIIGFAMAYTAFWGKFKWWVVLLYGAGCAAFLYLLYDRVLHTPFIPPFFMA